ncbi:AMP-binding protein [Plantibacter sp. YIM 135347]|uniref:AMP-binding protein n=1 Tax=Plantibacter sp. YIM 135347 TaxID=3423919 RepID=UPI003D326073
MTRALQVVPAEPAELFDALHRALDGSGPAVLPARLDAPMPQGLPDTVERKVAVIVETSGSTGEPKRVVLSTSALLQSAAGSGAALGGHGQRQWLLALPAHYIAGINVLVRSIAEGTTPVILEPGPFDVAEFCRHVERMTGDSLFAALVPAQLADLVSAAEVSTTVRDTLRGMHGLLVGGQSTPLELRERADALDLRIVRSYGSSETSGGCVYDGVPFAGVDARLIDDVLELSGPVLAEGYLGDPVRTAAAFPEEGGRRWYRTGDTARLVDGAVQITGRADNVIISGGINVSLDRVQRAVRSIPGLADAVVLGIDDERFGQASVVVTAGAGTLDDARTAVEHAVGRHARPVRLERVAAIPTLASGKPDVQALRALLTR